MHARKLILGLVAAAATAWLISPALGEIVSIRGSATAAITEFRAGQIGDQDEAAETYPDTSSTLPLQVVVRSVDPDKRAAAAVAAQFADPRTTTSPDPDEFAINLALNSLTPNIQYTASSSAEEIRGVRYTAAEVAPAAAGETIQCIGRVYLDGALAIFAGNDVTDLTGSSVTLRVTVVKEVSGRASEQVFLGTLTVTGAADRRVNVSSGGRFPTSGVFRTDLSAIDAQLSVFEAVVFPSLAIDYPYSAVVDEEFTLRATVQVDATNLPGQVGVAALIGTPFDALNEVITTTKDESTASKMTTALLRERATPTGKPAFEVETTDETACPLCAACGLLGFETVLGAMALVGLRAASPYARRVARRPG